MGKRLILTRAFGAKKAALQKTRQNASYKESRWTSRDCLQQNFKSALLQKPGIRPLDQAAVGWERKRP